MSTERDATNEQAVRKELGDSMRRESLLSMPSSAPGASTEILDKTLRARQCAGPVGERWSGLICGQWFTPVRRRQVCAPGHTKCYARYWDEKHPRKPRKHLPRCINGQATWPTMKAVLVRLKAGPATVRDLFDVAGPGFSTCISRLRVKRHRIAYDRTTKLYRLEMA